MKLQDFKVQSESDDSYHLAHPNGRIFTVIKKDLDPKAHEAFKKMCMGGEAQKLNSGGSPMPEALPPPDSGVAMLAANQAEADKQAQQQAAMTAALTPPQPEPVQSVQPSASAPVPDPAQTQTLPMADVTAAPAQQTIAPRTSAAPVPDSELRAQLQDDQTRFEELTKQRMDANDAWKAYASDPKNKFDPNRFYNNLGTGSKIGIGIAAALAGMGQHAAGGRNLALDAVDNAINRDIDAQKNDRSNAMNAYKLNEEALGSAQAAVLQTRMQHLGLAENKMNELLGNAPGPMALQRAQVMKQGLQADYQKTAMQLAAYKMATGGGSGGPTTEAGHVQRLSALNLISPELYKDAEKKYFPGVGISRIDATPEDHQAMQEFDRFDQAIADAKNFTHSGWAKVPFTTEAAQANSKREAIANTLGQLESLKRITPELKQSYLQMAADPGSWRGDKARGLYDELQRQVDQNRKSFMDKLGLQPFATSQKDMTAINWAKQTLAKDPSNQQAQQILKVNGHR